MHFVLCQSFSFLFLFAQVTSSLLFRNSFPELSDTHLLSSKFLTLMHMMLQHCVVQSLVDPGLMSCLFDRGC